MKAAFFWSGIGYRCSSLVGWSLGTLLCECLLAWPGSVYWGNLPGFSGPPTPAHCTSVLYTQRPSDSRRQWLPWDQLALLLWAFRDVFGVLPQRFYPMTGIWRCGSGKKPEALIQWHMWEDRDWNGHKRLWKTYRYFIRPQILSHPDEIIGQS
jgi:hypothetical protein